MTDSINTLKYHHLLSHDWSGIINTPIVLSKFLFILGFELSVLVKSSEYFIVEKTLVNVLFVLLYNIKDFYYLNSYYFTHLMYVFYL
jgi:predicted acyltransferase